MPARFVIEKEHRLVISTAWDRVTYAEILAHRDQLVRNFDFNPEFNQLVDGAAVTALDITMDEAKAIAGSSIFSPTSRRAFVASGLSILAMARLVETYSRMRNEREQVKVFRDLDVAVKWLGLDTVPR